MVGYLSIDSPLALIILQRDILENSILNSNAGKFGSRLLDRRDHFSKISQKKKSSESFKSEMMEVRFKEMVVGAQKCKRDKKALRAEI